jgi:primosomal protein N' (replication factor Y)
VEVPFGSQMVQGIILSLEETSSVPETRPISQILEEAPVLNHAQLELGRWLSEHYFTPISAYLFAMLPPGLGQHADTLYQLTASAAPENAEHTPLQKRIVALLQDKGSLRARQFDRYLAHVDWRASIRPLVRQGLIQSHPLLPKPSVKARQVRSVKSCISDGQVDAAAEKLGRAGTQAYARRLTALRLLAQEGKEVDVSWYTPPAG